MHGTLRGIWAKFTKCEDMGNVNPIHHLSSCYPLCQCNQTKHFRMRMGETVRWSDAGGSRVAASDSFRISLIN